MRLNFFFYAIAVFSFLALTSCGDDPKMVEKREQQKSEITRLKGEIALIEEKLKSLPPDVSSELAEAKVVSAKQSAEVARLEREVADLDSHKRALQSEFDAYRIKYQVK
jgi:predicted  nucleic acid-binding Zn-ribbon protein